jgi:hypothetical protein
LRGFTDILGKLRAPVLNQHFKDTGVPHLKETVYNAQYLLTAGRNRRTWRLEKNQRNGKRMIQHAM